MVSSNVEQFSGRLREGLTSDVPSWMRSDKFAREGLTFDDVLLVPAEFEVQPGAVSLTTRLTRNISVNIPIVSSAMDTVTEARMAIALAREGGIGIIHRNLPIDTQVAEVDKVKRSEAGMIVEPITLRPENLVADALQMMAHYHISGIPITDELGPTGRHSDQSRPPLRRRSNSTDRAPDDAREPHYGARRDHAR